MSSVGSAFWNEGTSGRGRADRLDRRGPTKLRMRVLGPRAFASSSEERVDRQVKFRCGDDGGDGKRQTALRTTCRRYYTPPGGKLDDGREIQGAGSSKALRPCCPSKPILMRMLLVVYRSHRS